MSDKPQITAKALFAKDEVQSKFKDMLGKRSTSFITSVLQIVASNEYLTKADPYSIYHSAAVAATLDLPINNQLGFAYIIPYNQKVNGNYIQVAQFQIGYKGYKQLALRSGQFKIMNATDVREGEIVKIDRRTGEIEFKWIQDEKERDKLPVIGYLSYFELHNGYSKQLYMSVEKIEKHAKKYSQTYKKNYGVWKDDFESMAMKTVTKLNLSKDAPLSVEMQKALIFDQAIVNDSDTTDVTYVDNTEEPDAIPVNHESDRVKKMIQSATELEHLSDVGRMIDDFPEHADLFTMKQDEIKQKKNG